MVNVALTVAVALTRPPQLSLTVAVSLSRPSRLIVTYKYPSSPPVLSKSFARFISTPKGYQISSVATPPVFLTSGTPPPSSSPPAHSIFLTSDARGGEPHPRLCHGEP